MSTEAPEPWHFDREVAARADREVVGEDRRVVWWASDIHDRVATSRRPRLADHRHRAGREVSALTTELRTRDKRDPRRTAPRAAVNAIGRRRWRGWRVAWTRPRPHLAQAAERDQCDSCATNPRHRPQRSSRPRKVPFAASGKDAGVSDPASNRDHPGRLELGRNSVGYRCCCSKGFVIIRAHQAVLAGDLA